jgi:hypothetical protein
MTLTAMLAQAQGGRLFAQVAGAIGLDEATTRAAMMEICPAIISELKAAAEGDDSLLETLARHLAEGNEGSVLDDPGVLTGAESIKDGNAILAAIYGSKAGAMEDIKTLVGGVPAAKLSKLAAVSATAAVSALMQSHAITPLAGVHRAAGSGMMRAATSELNRQVRSVVKPRKAPAKRTAAAKRPAARKTPARKTAARKAPAKRSTQTGITIEDIFGSILGRK